MKNSIVAIRSLNKIIKRVKDGAASIDSIEIENDLRDFPNQYGIVQHVPTGWHTLTVRWIETVKSKRKNALPND